MNTKFLVLVVNVDNRQMPFIGESLVLSMDDAVTSARFVVETHLRFLVDIKFDYVSMAQQLRSVLLYSDKDCGICIKIIRFFFTDGDPESQSPPMALLRKPAASYSEAARLSQSQ